MDFNDLCKGIDIVEQVFGNNYALMGGWVPELLYKKKIRDHGDIDVTIFYYESDLEKKLEKIYSAAIDTYAIKQPKKQQEIGIKIYPAPIDVIPQPPEELLIEEFEKMHKRIQKIKIENHEFQILSPEDMFRMYIPCLDRYLLELRGKLSCMGIEKKVLNTTHLKDTTLLLNHIKDWDYLVKNCMMRGYKWIHLNKNLIKNKQYTTDYEIENQESEIINGERTTKVKIPKKIQKLWPDNNVVEKYLEELKKQFGSYEQVNEIKIEYYEEIKMESIEFENKCTPCFDYKIMEKRYPESFESDRKLMQGYLESVRRTRESFREIAEKLKQIK